VGREQPRTTGWRAQRTPRSGDRIELAERRLGVATRGTIQYVDDFQILIKWDDGRSQNLRPGNVADRFWLLEDHVGDPLRGRPERDVARR
jgi:hypothetical protein